MEAEGKNASNKNSNDDKTDILAVGKQVQRNSASENASEEAEDGGDDDDDDDASVDDINDQPDDTQADGAGRILAELLNDE